MNILLTGCTGFIGCHTLNRLLQCHSITGIDLQAPAAAAQAPGNSHGSFRFIQGDLADDHTYEAIGDQSFDAIIHLAAQNESTLLKKDPSTLFSANIAATQKLLKYAVDHEVKRFVFASTTLIEDQTAYTKTGGEMLAQAYHTHYGVSVTTLRFPSVYGPNQPQDAPFSKIADALIKSESLPEDQRLGEQQLYVSDAVTAIEQSIQQTAPEHQLVDLSNQYHTSTAEIIQQMKRALNIESGASEAFQQCPLQKWDEVKTGQGLINFKAATALETGVELFCQWFLTQQSNHGSFNSPPQ